MNLSDKQVTSQRQAKQADLQVVYIGFLAS